MVLGHEKLEVYQVALKFAADVEVWIKEWDSKHAICDQLPRAAASIVENLAMASASCSGMKVRGLDYALGSTLECAACLDIAEVTGLMENETAVRQKIVLLKLFKMSVGLRHAWAPGIVAEDSAQYGENALDSKTDEAWRKESNVFHHDRLDVHRVALEVARPLSSCRRC